MPVAIVIAKVVTSMTPTPIVVPQLLIDDNGIVNFIDDNSVQCFIDDLGRITLCPP